LKRTTFVLSLDCHFLPVMHIIYQVFRLLRSIRFRTAAGANLLPQNVTFVTRIWNNAP